MALVGAADREEHAQGVLDRFLFDDLRRSQPFLINSTAQRPLASAARRRSACTAGIAALPGSAMPSASAIDAMVEAVPITAQVPGRGGEVAFDRLDLGGVDLFPARCSAQNRRQSVQAPEALAVERGRHHRAGEKLHRRQVGRGPRP
jgi:hypothetical protein